MVRPTEQPEQVSGNSLQVLRTLPSSRTESEETHQSKGRDGSRGRL